MEQLNQLRRLALSKQGLLSKKIFSNDINGTLSAIEHLGYVQIDTLSIVERAHHHVLWNRVPNYAPDHLNQLIASKDIFEYWYHAASYLPMKDFRFSLPHINSVRRGENRYYQYSDEKSMNEILAHIKADGPLQVRSMEKKTNEKSNWFNSGPRKRALEVLFMRGDIMICKRNGVEKVYDLPERCLPDGLNTSEPTISEYTEYILDTTIRAHGVFVWKQLMHLKTGKPLREAMRQGLNDRIQSGIIKKIVLDDSREFYVDSIEYEKNLPSDCSLKILSPFDNLVIHRERLNLLFDFNYRIECYTPPNKRKYGYFCLPILYNEKLIGRVDCKAHRAEKRFEVLGLFLENNLFDRDFFYLSLIDELQKFSDFNGCPELDKKIINTLT
ncbi:MULTISPECIES: winged helix-turn-helix domain-containing protein [unclassified Serratia (in: enterobacteria)]|uniref:winged helix-turn-helix domain-containing protein n=1 Tax=unclassified Serratia (in: enterobacteria) TaxID=2647522 RepID=UPI0030760D68